jgi:cadmium resistance protein CadD (predicted permease)
VSAAVVGALSPVATMATIAVLAARNHPLRNAVGLLIGWSVVLMLLAAGLLALFGDSGAGLSDATKAVLNVVIGILLLSFGMRNLLGARHPLAAAAEGDPDRHPEPPHWMRSLDRLSLLKAIGVGGVLLCVSPADLAVYVSALNGLAGRSSGTRLLLTALLVVAIDLCILVPLAVYVAMPRRATQILASVRTWLMAWVCAVFGVYLLISGITKLA